MVLRVLFLTLARLLDIFSFLMLIRAILSWIIQPGTENTFILVLHKLTDFVVEPVRSVLERFDFVNRIPLDISFLVAYMLVQMLSGVCSGMAILF